MTITNIKQTKYIIILAIFLVSIYIGTQINFFNNDDWVHYKTVENFIRNDFSLHPYIGSTFYTQGILAYLYSKVFGMSTLPVLTILVSLFNILIFHRILNLINFKNRFLKILSILLFALNPLYAYSAVGFMTENYVIFFLLLAIYFQIRYMQNNKYTDLALSTFFIVLGFFVKQYMLFLSFGTIAYLAVKKRWKLLFAYYHIPAIIFLFYTFLFPKNEILSQQSLDLVKLTDVNATITLVLTIFLYLCFFTIPLSLIFGFGVKSHRYLTFVLFAVILFIQLKFLSVEDFPSLTNVLDRKGLFQDIDGNKSHWAGYYKFFTYTFYISIATSSLVLAKIILRAKSIYENNKFLTLSFSIYFGLCAILPIFYDRYILPLVIVWVLILYKESAKLEVKMIMRRASITWLVIFGFFTYLFISDFIVRNIAIENASRRLISEGVQPQEIIANRAWNNYYEVDDSKAKYLFHHDKPESMDRFTNPTLESTVHVNFPLNIFTSNEIYLYKIVNENQPN